MKSGIRIVKPLNESNGSPTELPALFCQIFNVTNQDMLNTKRYLTKYIKCTQNYPQKPIKVIYHNNMKPPMFLTKYKQYMGPR